MTKLSNKKEALCVGWREWVGLPDIGIKQIKAKVDTGARSSSIHAFDIEEYSRSGKDFVKFRVCPIQKSNKKTPVIKARLIDVRNVRDSGGKVTRRPVIETTLKIGEFEWNIEMTLSNRDEMGFRMLIGRTGIPKDCLVNPHKSYLIGKKKRKKL